MKEIKLKELRIRNFQGIKEFTLSCTDETTEVHGDNATGKTTLKNAFTWMLFNKNSKGLTKFGFKPLDSEGNLIHGLETSVEGLFEVDSNPVSFKRSITEKISTVRGTNTKSFKDVSEWFVDGVPKKKSEYEKEVSKLIDEDIFKMITDPLYFNTQIKWDERRNILMDICGDISDKEILDSSEELKELESMLNGKSVIDFKEITSHAIKPVSESLKKIPVQIDEAERAKPNQCDLEYDEGQRQFLLSIIDEKERELAYIKHGAAITKKREELNEVNVAYANAQKPFDEYSTDEYSKIQGLKQQKFESEQLLKSESKSIELSNNSLETNKLERQKLSKEWDDIFGQEFNGNICPTCHQELPPDEVEAHKKEFNLKKSNDLDIIERKLEVLNKNKKIFEDEISSSNKSISNLKEYIDKYDQELHGLESKLEDKRNKHKEEQSNKLDELNKRYSDIKKEIEDIEKNSADIIEKLEVEISNFKDDKNSIDEKIANKALLEKQEKRIEELKEQEKKQAIEFEGLQRKLYLCEEFIRTKAEMLTERINSNFSIAKFKLFDIQKNEGVKETCEVTYEGVPFTDLNSAGQINIGLDIINTLCKKYDVTAPIIIDNAESVTNLFDTFSQKITLVVDESCKELTVK